MPKTPWEKVASELTEHGIQSKFMARIQSRVRPENRLANVEQEIIQEIAGALGRSEDRVNLALAECDLLYARYAEASGAVKRELAAQFNAQRLVARARLRDLLIHREAAGFRRNGILDELYPIPPAIEESR